MSDVSESPQVWISRRSAAEREPGRMPTSGPLAGLTVAVKDNIDVAGLPTTAACAEFAFTPTTSAAAVQRLEAAGAVIVGKTNMDQFATGLVGTRSPYGALSSVADPAVISGGSSSGSAVAVASGECELALGTDTAGSGRVPAALNGVVGLKPTPGIVSTTGVVPACRSLDCVSVFARSVALARLALGVIRDESAGSEPRLPANPRIGVPRADQLEFFGDTESPALYDAAIERLRAMGAQVVPVDFAPFQTAGELLYGGPWVAERYVAVGRFIRAHSGPGIDPIVREIILGADEVSGAEVFRGMYELSDLIAATRSTWTGIDALALPTVALAPTHDQVADDPHGVNTKLGHYTRFVNLMNLCAISVPAGRWSGGVPFGLQLVAPPGHDALVCDLAERFERASMDASRIRLAVVGAHLVGQPLNHQLTTRGARLVLSTRTAPEYRLFRLPGQGLPKPGLVHSPGSVGVGAIEVEVWELDAQSFGAFVAEVPPPLAIGNVLLADGQWVKGFVCEPHALSGAQEITATGGWRAYLSQSAGLGTIRRVI